ncbi:MAG: hypothetical protein U9O89_00185 [Thermoproteota archaeon]|nr:hypothetical protein [Thermoproteota archaeon]
MSGICDWVLAADERIRFCMVTDELGNVKCMKSVGLYDMPRSFAERLGDTLAVMVGSTFKELALHHGSFEYAMVKHERFSTVGLRIAERYLVFTVKNKADLELIERVINTVKMQEKPKKLVRL